MAGRGPAPADDRIRPHEPGRGEWRPAPGSGWQHGDIPPCPVRGAAARSTWDTWFRAWWAANWSPEDLPNLRLVIKLWARVDSGKATGSERSELRQLMDSYGLTPKGLQDRRWKPPKVEEPTTDQPANDDSPYSHLRVV
jgi:hypothetical protein